jgi:hypothetical protein
MTMQGMWFVFAGFMIPRPQMPCWWIWFNYLCPPAWTLHAIIASQLGDKVCIYALSIYEAADCSFRIVTACIK